MTTDTHAPPRTSLQVTGAEQVTGDVTNTASTADDSEDLKQLVSFIVGGEEFGISILRVQEIIRPMQITQVPHAPAFVEGIINLRGRIVPVVDLRQRFGFSSRENDSDTRILVLETEEQEVGFVADAVREVLQVDASTIEPAPQLAAPVEARYLRGVAKLEDRLLILLDLEGVLSREEACVLEEIQAEATSNE